MLDKIRSKVQAGQFELTKHAVDQSILRRISIEGMRNLLVRGEMIEDYPEAKYGPSCLILGFTVEGGPLPIQRSYPSRPLIKVITVYGPDPA